MAAQIHDQLLPPTGPLPPAPPQADPFVLLGIDACGELDESMLRPRWLELSRRVHPDRFQQDGGDQLEHARDWSALVNKAYNALKDPQARLLALLEREGLADTRDSAAKQEAPKDLLMEVFELQEMLDDLGARAPDAQERTGIENQRAEYARRISKARDAYAGLLKRWDAEPGGHAAIAREFNSLRSRQQFFQRLLGTIEDVLTR